MADNIQEDLAGQETRAVVYLDDATEPLLSYRPPVHFELDTSVLDDGQHQLRIEAFDSTGQKGVRTIRFTVRNGPGIAVSGLRDNDVLEGKVSILVNSYGGVGETHWEPSRAETPAPIPTWAWILFIAVVAFGAFYGVSMWKPSASFAATPTYGVLALKSPEPAVQRIESAAASTGSEQPADDAALGATVYANNCSACHQANGMGLPGVFPHLVGNSAVIAKDPTVHIKAVLDGVHGKTIDGVKYASPMPPWADQLNDAQIAAVVNHERSSWGNDAPHVTAADVARLRAAK